jgi:hypothetical protein
MTTNLEGGETYGYKFNKNSPIKIERDFLIDDLDSQEHTKIWLN